MTATGNGQQATGNNNGDAGQRVTATGGTGELV